MNKKRLSIAIAGALGTLSLSAHAGLTYGTFLDFTGSYSWDAGSYLITTAIQSGPDGGIMINEMQDTNGHMSHGGLTSHAEGGIDLEWVTYGNTGMHFTTSPIVVVDNDVNNDGGFTQTLDFSGWRMTWNGIPSIDLGGGFQDCGTTNDGICVSANSYIGDVGGTHDNGSGLATITCSTASCSYSSTFTLTYSAVVPQADPSDYGGVPYQLNLTGHVFMYDPGGIPGVPLPPAAWLLGSGLAGLLMKRRRRQDN